MLARFQHGTILYNAERGKLSVADLPGAGSACAPTARPPAPGSAAFSKTTIGVDLSRVHWVTFEDGHVAEAKEPPGVIRAGADQDMTKMLIDGELDAAIYGAALPNDPRLQSVIPDPDAAARAWYGQHGLVPVNHMVVVTETLARSSPQAVAELYRLLEASKAAAGLPAAGRHRYGAVRESGQPALPRTAGFLCGAAGPDSAAVCRRRALVGEGASAANCVRIERFCSKLPII